MPVRVGVVGCGWFGSAHARVYRTIGDAHLVAVMDVVEESAKRLAERYHVNHYTSIGRMIREESLDAVSIAVTPQYLFKATKEALEAGASVLVEKPVVINKEELENLKSLIRKQGGLFMPGFIELFNPAVISAKELLDEGRIGSPLSIWSRRVGRFPKKSMGWKIGVSLDLAIHEMYVQNYLMGSSPSRVYSYTAKLLDGEGEEDLAIFIVIFSEGVTSTIETNWLTPSGIREALIMGEGGSILISYPDQEVRIEFSDRVEQPRIRRSEPLQGELSYFVDHVKKGSEPDINIEFAEKVLNSLFEGLNNRFTL